MRVYYDEGNSRLSSISAFIRGPLLFVTTLRNPHPSDSPSSASYSVSASSLRRLIHVYLTILISGAALTSVVSGALRCSVSSSRRGVKFEFIQLWEMLSIGILLLGFWLF